jgi:hypothetical protein
VRQGLTGLALWWFVYAVGYHADFAGPFATEFVCDAAARGAVQFGMPGVCVSTERIDDYLDKQRFDDYGEWGGPS